MPVTSSLTTYRSDIEGMRAVAIGLVVLYHAGVPPFRGGYVGVDVFFVLSGFLITGVMLRDIDRTGTLSLMTFWARRARRLLPAAFVALAGASVITWLWLPLTQRDVFGKDIFSAAIYVVNWRLARRSVDYLADDVWLSPVQHFWSLAVEEQFYILWPLLVVVALVLARRSGVRSHAALGTLIGIAVVASFSWSVIETGSEPISAYFSTFTRFWEIGLGAIVALSVRFFRSAPDRALALAGWIGLGGVVASSLWLSDSTPFPSYWALWPTASAALLIISGLREAPGSPFRLLSTRPAVWLGGLSYSVYLWHWLALVAATAWWGTLSVLEGVLVVTLSVVPAALVHRFIENPIRFGELMKRPRNALAVGGAFAAASAACGVVLIFSVAPFEIAEALESGEGAVALAESDIDWSAVDEVPSIKPDPLYAKYDLPDAHSGGCMIGVAATEPRTCVYGDATAAKTVMLVGDSKAVQWESAMQVIAEQSEWRLVVMAKAGCTLSNADQMRKGRRFTACREWNEAAIQTIADEDPDLVIVSGLASEGVAPADPTSSAGETVEAMVDGLATQWRRIEELGIPVVVILDNPSPPNQVYQCVEQNRDALTTCGFALAPAVAESGAPVQGAAAELTDVDQIDLTDSICPNQCPPVIGNVLVYRQDSHLTRTYVVSLVPYLSARLSEITDGMLGES